MDITIPEILAELIEHADSGEHVEFTLIKTWEEYLDTYKKLSALKNIIKILSKGSKKLFKLYCADVKALEADVTTLLVAQALDETQKFYKEDYEIVHSMLDEYEIYLLAGNLLNFGTRSDDLLWDHREAKQWNNL